MVAVLGKVHGTKKTGSGSSNSETVQRRANVLAEVVAEGSVRMMAGHHEDIAGSTDSIQLANEDVPDAPPAPPAAAAGGDSPEAERRNEKKEKREASEQQEESEYCNEARGQIHMSGRIPTAIRAINDVGKGQECYSVRCALTQEEKQQVGGGWTHVNVWVDGCAEGLVCKSQKKKIAVNSCASGSCICDDDK